MTKKKRKKNVALPPKTDILKGKPINEDALKLRLMNATSPIRDDQGQYDGFTWKEKLKIKRKKRKK